MKKYKNFILITILFIILSVVFYLLQIVIFSRTEDTFFYFFQDLGFIPLEVLFVTIIINRLLTIREKNERMKKLNMVIGGFFSEVGTKLLELLSQCDYNSEKILKSILVENAWEDMNYDNISHHLMNYECSINVREKNLAALQDFLIEKRGFLLNLLANPNVLEHDTFSSLLWAIFHMAEEFLHRKNVSKLNEKDAEHLEIDIKRAYEILIIEWLKYMKHLKDDYPYLFSLAMRRNPFDPNAEVEFK
ncbi:hypothetical protein ACFL20_03110 [Spirochaetota bacterium]